MLSGSVELEFCQSSAYLAQSQQRQSAGYIFSVMTGLLKSPSCQLEKMCGSSAISPNLPVSKISIGSYSP